MAEFQAISDEKGCMNIGSAHLRLPMSFWDIGNGPRSSGVDSPRNSGVDFRGRDSS